MEIITKEQAHAVAAAFKSRLADRIAQYLANLASSGIVGGQICYSCEDDEHVKVAISGLIKCGWMVAHDPLAKTLTIT